MCAISSAAQVTSRSICPQQAHYMCKLMNLVGLHESAKSGRTMDVSSGLLS